MLSILRIKFPSTCASGLDAAGPAAGPSRSCRLPLSDEKLKLDSKGVVGVVSCDLAVGKGGKALSWGVGNKGDAGRLGNGDVELRRNGILNGDLGRLLCIAGDVVRAVFSTIGFDECWSECMI